MIRTPHLFSAITSQYFIVVSYFFTCVILTLTKTYRSSSKTKKLKFSEGKFWFLVEFNWRCRYEKTNVLLIFRHWFGNLKVQNNFASTLKTSHYFKEDWSKSSDDKVRKRMKVTFELDRWIILFQTERVV